MNSMGVLDYMEPLERPRGTNVADYVPDSPAEAVDLMIHVRGHLFRMAEASKERNGEWGSGERKAFITANRLYLRLKRLRDASTGRRSDFMGRCKSARPSAPKRGVSTVQWPQLVAAESN